MLQRADPAFEHQLSPPIQLDPATAADFAVHDAAAGDDAKARDLDGRDDLHPAFANLPVGRLAQTLGGALDILGELVDDVVVANLDLRPLRGRGCSWCGLEVEAHDDRIGDSGRQKVRARHGAYALADYLDRDPGVLDLLQCCEHRFERALRVGLDHQAELLDLAFLGATGELFERDARRDVLRRLERAPLGQLGERDLASGFLRADDLEDVAGLRDLAHTGHYDWRRRRRLGHALGAVVRQGAHAAIDVAAHEVVADLQRPGLDEHGGHRATAPLEVGVDDGADSVAVGVGLQLEDVR